MEGLKDVQRYTTILHNERVYVFLNDLDDRLNQAYARVQ